MVKADRKYRDRLFHFLFGKEERKDWTLELYNAVNGTQYTDPQQVQITTIEEALYLGMKNDVSFLITNTLNLYEQQSTVNPNMPLRNLQYVGNLFEKYIEANSLNKYGTRRLPLPVPKFVVFYNGDTKTDDEQVLKLSDSFPPDSDPDIEVRTRVLNINEGHNHKLLKQCRPLQEYAWVTGAINRYHKELDLDIAIERVLQEIPDSFLIKPLLKAHQAEVKGMLLAEYDEEKQRALDRKDGVEDGILGAIQIMRRLGLKNEAILSEIMSQYQLSESAAERLLQLAEVK